MAHKRLKDLKSIDIPPSSEASFWDRIRIDMETGCWLWQRPNPGSVYARFKIGGQRLLVHRISYALAYGCTPGDMDVLHACDTPLCVAPHHLRLGTPSENAADKIERSRQARGSRVGTAKLRDEDIRAIRQDTRPARIVGEDYGVGKSAVQKIRQGVNWAHV